MEKSKKKREKRAKFPLNNSFLPFFFFFFMTGTRVAVRYSFATCSSIMQIHMHERCTYNSLSLARVTNAWRFAGSICQLAEKAGEIKGRSGRGDGTEEEVDGTRERERERRGGEIGERGWKDEEVTGVGGTNLSGSIFRRVAPLKFLYISFHE